MCANQYRGEVSLNVNGKPALLRMNFNAISCLEAKMGSKSLPQLIERFAEQKYSAQDIISVLESGYFGANRKYMDFKDSEIDGGVKAAAFAAVLLLKLAFDGVESGS